MYIREAKVITKNFAHHTNVTNKDQAQYED